MGTNYYLFIKNKNHDYRFHIKQSTIGEGIALVVCAAVGLVIHFLL